MKKGVTFLRSTSQSRKILNNEMYINATTALMMVRKWVEMHCRIYM